MSYNSTESCRTNLDLLPGRKLAQADLGNVLVAGLGVSGKAVVRYLCPKIGNRVTSLTVLGGTPSPQIEQWASRLYDDSQEAVDEGKLNVLFGSEDVNGCAPEGGFDLCIVSPGISMFSDFYQSAKSASKRMIGELEFAWEESPKNSVWVAITGTNGKTTTTKLIEHILIEAGHMAQAIGNIGDAAIEAVALESGKAGSSEPSGGNRPFFVAEASSYQLASMQFFAPEVAVILGITPDHIAWHKTHEHYKQSKFNVLSNLIHANDAVAVLDATNDEVREKVKEIKSKPKAERGFAYIPLGTSRGIEFDMREACGAENSAFVDTSAADELIVSLDGKEHKGGPADSLKIKGAHNRINALAAMSAAVALGVGDDVLASALSSFEPLEHRIEPVGTKRGILYVNDSKGTNVDATIQAVGAFEPIKPIVMLGGRDKGTDLTQLVDSCVAHAKAVICYGEARERFEDAFEDAGIDVIGASGFDEAFDVATGYAEEGDIVLLSPACASFDEFSCFEERGERFKKLFASLDDAPDAS